MAIHKTYTISIDANFLENQDKKVEYIKADKINAEILQDDYRINSSFSKKNKSFSKYKLTINLPLI